MLFECKDIMNAKAQEEQVEVGIEGVEGLPPWEADHISAAGNGAGIDGERSGLWREMARIIGEVRPKLVFVENSPLLVARGLAVVVSDLAEMGYDAEWCCISASDTGAPHKRDRIWLVAYASELQRHGVNYHAGISLARKSIPESGDDCGTQDVADALREREQRIIASQLDAQVRQKQGERQDRPRSYGGTRWPTEPDVGRVADGVAHPITWVVRAGPRAGALLTGGRATLAGRMTRHPLAAALCRAAGMPLVSTSANMHGRPPARSPLAVRRALRAYLDMVVAGATARQARPTEIRLAAPGRVLRAG